MRPIIGNLDLLANIRLIKDYITINKQQDEIHVLKNKHEFKKES